MVQVLIVDLRQKQANWRGECRKANNYVANTVAYGPKIHRLEVGIFIV